MRITKVLLLAFFATFVGTVFCHEFRSPLSIENGPMRYVIEEFDEEDYSLKIWTAGYGRESHKAFMSHGTKTHELSKLIFGKSDFLLSDAFPNSKAEMGTEYYSPYIGVTTLNPRVTYSEKGLSLGVRWAYPINKNKGRIGVRAQVPFRKIEMEREDLGDEDGDPLADLMTTEVVTRVARTGGGGNDAKNVVARAIRMDFLQTIPY